MSAKTDNFINKISPMAIEDMKKNNILASLTIAQAILESGWGESTLATKANNLFGIKASSDWKGKVFNIKTLEYFNNSSATTVTACFKAYDSWAEGIKDHSDLFLTNSRYSSLIGETDYKKACEKVKSAGYATDPKYVSKLVKIIETYELHKYDSVTASNNSTTSEKEVYRVRKSWSDAESQIGAYSNLDNAKSMCDKNIGYKVYNSKGEEVYTCVNKYHTVVKGDTLYSLAKKYNTTVDVIQKLNNLKGTALTIGVKLLLA